MKTKAKNAPPCAPSIAPEAVEGTGQNPSVFISYRSKADAIIARRAQTLLAVSEITCRVPAPSDRGARPKEKVVIRFDRKTISCAWEAPHDLVARLARNLVQTLTLLEVYACGVRSSVQSPRTAKRTKKGAQRGQK